MLVAGIGSLQIVLERGERADWFAATYIVALTIVSAGALLGFIFWELAHEHPIVDLRVLKRRSLALGTVFTFILGFGLYSSVFMFPVFAQNLLGFSAVQTGLLLMPGGLATALMMPIMGKLLQYRVPPQLLNAAGFFLFFIFTLQLSHSNLSSGESNFFWPLILRGIALSFLFVPLTTVALSQLKGKDIAQGTGLTNMMRQLGGSFGVALAATFVQHRSWQHRHALAAHVSLYDPSVRQTLDAIKQTLLNHGSAAYTAQQQAYGVLDNIILHQTTLLTYLNTFRLVGYFFLACIPLLLLFGKPPNSSPTRRSPSPLNGDRAGVRGENGD